MLLVNLVKCWCRWRLSHHINQQHQHPQQQHFTRFISYSISIISCCSQENVIRGALDKWIFIIIIIIIISKVSS